MVLAEYMVATAGALGGIGVLATFMGAWWDGVPRDGRSENDDPGT